jgi:hypothetical protein
LVDARHMPGLLLLETNRCGPARMVESFAAIDVATKSCQIAAEVLVWS